MSSPVTTRGCDLRLAPIQRLTRVHDAVPPLVSSIRVVYGQLASRFFTAVYSCCEFGSHRSYWACGFELSLSPSH